LHGSRRSARARFRLCNSTQEGRMNSALAPSFTSHTPTFPHVHETPDEPLQEAPGHVTARPGRVVRFNHRASITWDQYVRRYRSLGTISSQVLSDMPFLAMLVQDPHLRVRMVRLHGTERCLDLHVRGDGRTTMVGENAGERAIRSSSSGIPRSETIQFGASSFWCSSRGVADHLWSEFTLPLPEGVRRSGRPAARCAERGCTARRGTGSPAGSPRVAAGRSARATALG